MRILKFLVLVLFYIFSIAAVGCFCADKQLNTHFYLYNRVITYKGNYQVYSDYIVIPKDTVDFITAKAMYTFARRYIDTAKADKPVARVRFMKIESCRSLPTDPADDMFDDITKASLIGFNFSNAFPKDSTSKKPDLISIILWQNGEPEFYDYRFKSNQKNFIDSILNSPYPFIK